MKASEPLQNDQSTATEKALRLALDTTPAFIHTARPDGYLDYFNRRWLDFLGKSLEDVCGWHWTESVHPEDVAGIVQKWRAALASGEAFVAEARVRCGDGTYRAFLHRKVPLHDEHGNIVKWFGSSIDIEDRKRAEKRRPLEAELQATLNVIPAYTWYALPSGALTFVNERTADYLGIPKDHPLRFGIDTGAEWDSHIPLLHPDDHEETRRVWSACLRTGCAGEISFRVRNAEGGYRWFHSRIEPLWASDGTLLYWVGVNLDIEERKQAEFYLAEGQRLAHTGSWAFNSAGFDYWSSELFRIYGLDPSGKAPTVEEYIGLVHPEDRGFVGQAIQKMLADHRGFDFTKRIVRPDGEIRCVRCVGVAACQGFVGTGIDVTEQKQLMEELRRNEYYLAEGQRLAQMGSWVFDPAGFFNYWSRELFRIYGFEPADEGPSLEEYLARVHPQDREFMGSLIKRMLAEASGCDVTKRIVRPNGEVRYVRCVGAPVIEDGTLKRIVGTAIDVTEHELLTQELRRREAYLVEAQRLSHTGSFGWNLATGELVWSDENFRILGYEPTVKPTVDLVLKRVHPDDLSFVRRMMEKAKAGTSLELEHRLLMPDGSVKHLHVIARPLTNESGELEFVGTVMDVTARKKAFEEIKALRDELYRENIVLREELGKTSMFEEVIGTSSVLQMVLAHAAKVAPTDSTVLILGETGTGKELIARAIHKRSKRSERPFISLNCAAVPSSLIMSELFGHEKGAFTGALQRRLGRFELAEGGTLFLDEVGDLPLETQIALLRVLQEREFERVGGTEVLRADVRVIAATNRDLQAAIADGAFRSDLYYRLNVFPIKLPPLRERKEDVPLLVNYFVDLYAKRAGKKIKHIQKKTLEALQEYSWPGNVRELQNVIERSLIIAETNEFSIDESWVANEPQPPTPATDRTLTERTRIEAALAQSNGKVAGAHGAAVKLGIPPSTLESKIRSLGINKFQFKGV